MYFLIASKTEKKTAFNMHERDMDTVRPANVSTYAAQRFKVLVLTPVHIAISILKPWYWSVVGLSGKAVTLVSRFYSVDGIYL